jgi:site-specific recombinase XerD
MSIYKRGKTYWFHFWLDGIHHQQSTHQGNPRVARQMEAAYRTRLAKEGVGIVERKPAPTLREFVPRFLEANRTRIHEPRTIKFYEDQVAVLLRYEPLAKARLSDIDERLIEDFVQHRRAQIYRKKPLAISTVNRALSTLRKLLGMAYDWRELERIPRVRKLKGEAMREFVLSQSDEKVYLEAAPPLLRDIAIAMLDEGLRDDESLSLMKADFSFEESEDYEFGYLHVREGKGPNAERYVGLTERAAAMFKERIGSSQSEFIFAGKSGKPMLVTSLNHLHAKLRKTLKLPKEFVLYCFRHTCFTRLGEAGEALPAMRDMAGHSSILVTMRYVHPSRKAVGGLTSRQSARNQRAQAELAETGK